ncbi:MAG: hypothetical protein ACR2N7_06975 [Acidimicrobiia bacterium]
MNTLILATEAAASYSGDDLATLSYILMGILLVITAVTTVIITPGAESSDH